MESENKLNDSEIVSEDVLEGLGISKPVYEEILTIIGRLPSVDELSTLLAMWQSQGQRQGLLTWLKGQPHSTERHDYLDSDAEPLGKEVREPRVKDCIAIAKSLHATEMNDGIEIGDREVFKHRGDAIYMVGDVSGLFVNSEYGRRYLHLVENAVRPEDDTEACEYLELILGALIDNESIFSICRVGRGGLFGTLVRCAAPSRLGFDILTCREVRLDAFLFGEEGVRFLVTMDEPKEDFFLQKLTEARVNCCFLGRATKGRVLVDDMDFGPIAAYTKN